MAFSSLLLQNDKSKTHNVMTRFNDLHMIVQDGAGLRNDKSRGLRYYETENMNHLFETIYHNIEYNF